MKTTLNQLRMFAAAIAVLTMANGLHGQHQPDWSQDARLDSSDAKFTSNDRRNVFGLDERQLERQIRSGAMHTIVHPVDISELMIPLSSMDTVYDPDRLAKLAPVAKTFIEMISPFRSYDHLYDWMGLTKFPTGPQAESPNYIPPNPNAPVHRMGTTITQKHGVQALTFSCAACHSGELFGVKIMGMSSRFPRNNEFFQLGKNSMQMSTREFYKAAMNPNAGDIQLYDDTRLAILHTDMARPQTLGLDTSLAQVSLSLATRANDDLATRIQTSFNYKSNRLLNSVPADSKPSVWWTLKYKTKWLSDGSVVSGNPIHTNFLWNEIGRGTDLVKLDEWLRDNQQTIDELTAYVFATEAPKFDDFFPNKIDIEKARRGQQLFLNHCSRCHGRYAKGWDRSDSETDREKIETTDVFYHSVTPVIDVGTDPLRHQGMKELAIQLNNLKISRSIGVVVKAQRGYVPPPLVGIWARWPYFHNNSVPSLYDVLTPDFKRPKKYISGPPINRETDFDQQRVGYPTIENVPSAWKANRAYVYSTEKQGLGNQGHTKRILTKPDGSEKFSELQKSDLIEFLKTL